MAAEIAVWAAAEAYKPIRRGIKQSESRRVMPSLLLIFPNIYSEKTVWESIWNSSDKTVAKVALKSTHLTSNAVSVRQDWKIIL